MYRSEEMSLIEIIMETESMMFMLNHIGRRGLLHFIDLSSSEPEKQRPFLRNILRCEDIQRILRYLRSQINEASFPIKPLPDSPSFLQGPYNPRVYDELEIRLSNLQSEVKEMVKNEEVLNKNFLELNELKAVVQTAQKLLRSDQSHPSFIPIATSSTKTMTTIISGSSPSPPSSLSSLEAGLQGIDEHGAQYLPLTQPLLGGKASEKKGGNKPSSSKAQAGYSHLEKDPGSSSTAGGGAVSINIESGEISMTSSRITGLTFLAGVVDQEKKAILQRILWRSFRGNLLLHMEDLEEPIKDLQQEKGSELVSEQKFAATFMVFLPNANLLSKATLICKSLGANLHGCPETEEERTLLLTQITERIQELENIIQKTSEFRHRLCKEISENLLEWEKIFEINKEMYATLNKFKYEVSTKCLIAHAWCPTQEISLINDDLQRARAESGSSISAVVTELKTKSTPPTYFKNSKFTSAFQDIIDVYGIPSYQEVNPALYTVITLPFLFAVMFGDIGHGILLTMIALFLVLNEKKLSKNRDEMFLMVFNGRYIMVLMGLFSIYTGLIYNDIFSRGIALFGSSGWEYELVEGTNNSYTGTFTGDTYPVGLDPGWHGADNMLLFTNSYKMKMSIIFGVIQMSFGVILSLMNHLKNKKYVSIFNEFFPQMIFLMAIFWYLAFCIIYKWLNNWDNAEAPSLMDLLIYMFLSPGRVDQPLYEGQKEVQIVLLVLAIISVPWMLLVKPFYLKYKNRKNYIAIGVEDGHVDEEEEPFDFGEEMIHQILHTIEYCLNSISNLASYLRLWALSLAHAQLSTVIWEMTLGKVIPMDNVFIQSIGLFFTFSAWFGLTVFILIMIEGLSAFLHALRLHWVEFNSKFFGGNGYAFEPLSFEKIVRTDPDL